MKGADFVEAQEALPIEMRQKLLVHCRAGIGRTGTTIALINAVLELRKMEKVEKLKE